MLPHGPSPGNAVNGSAQKLSRVTFRTSRTMDFFSERELKIQTDHDVEEWPLVVVKELFNNALDACEEAEIPPVVSVTADPSSITVSDNGPGLPEETLRGAMDFTVRVSSREAYISPCRGAQGNALKTLLPMPQVLDPKHGKLIITTGGKRHVITCGADPISQQAVIADEVTEVPKSTKFLSRSGTKKQALSGTEVRMEWQPLADGDEIYWPFDGMFPLSGSFPTRFRSLVEGYAVFNPHATIYLDWFGEKTEWKATNPNWLKWRPSQPTSPHWYEQQHLERLIGAYVTHDSEARIERLVSSFLEEFDGLKRSGKRTRVLDRSGLKRLKLTDLVVNDRFDSVRIAGLLEAMKEATRPINPKLLGIIGKDHLRARLLAMGVREESFLYCLKLAKEGLPGVLETAFGWLGPDARDRRNFYTGVNWSSAIKNPFRSFGDTGEGLETAMAKMKVTRYEPVVFVLHLAQPRIDYTNRGKTTIIVD